MDLTATCFSHNLWDVQVRKAVSSSALMRGVQVFAPSLREQADIVRLSSCLWCLCHIVRLLWVELRVNVQSRRLDSITQFLSQFFLKDFFLEPLLIKPLS